MHFFDYRTSLASYSFQAGFTPISFSFSATNHSKIILEELFYTFAVLERVIFCIKIALMTRYVLREGIICWSIILIYTAAFTSLYNKPIGPRSSSKNISVLIRYRLWIYHIWVSISHLTLSDHCVLSAPTKWNILSSLTNTFTQS